MARLIVVSAFACDPRLPSEPTIGWLFLNALSEVAAEADGVRVVAFMNARSQDITSQQWSGDERTSIVGVELPKILGFLRDPRLTRLEYLVWNIQVRYLLRKLEKSNDIILAHHVTFASEMLPTPIISLGKDTYKVWGPIGSSGNPDVYKIAPRTGHWRINYWIQRLRNFSSKKLAAINGHNANLVLTHSPSLSASLSSQGIKTRLFPNTVLDDELITEITAAQEHSPFPNKKTILCVGNLVYLKRFELAIAALTDSRLQETELVIIGKPASGQENYLRPLAERMGVASRVTFMGQVPRAIVLRIMEQADVIFHPSAREGAPGVVAEATAVGTPVVCFSGTGSAVVLKESGTSGLELDPVGLDIKRLASALAEAMTMPRQKTNQWSYARYRNLSHELVAEALHNTSNDKDV